jgi:hypothetical protein
LLDKQRLCSINFESFHDGRTRRRSLLLPADTISLFASERHRDRTQAAVRQALVARTPTRLRVAASLRRVADRLDAGNPEPASMIPLAGRGL